MNSGPISPSINLAARPVLPRPHVTPDHGAGFPLAEHPIDWKTIKLVVFDLDGTLYEQRPVRLNMLRELLLHSLRTRSIGDLLTIRRYRTAREALAENGAPDFIEQLHKLVGARSNRTPHEVARLAEEWVEQRPLKYLLAARIAGAGVMFKALRRGGRPIGVWSDYPVGNKLMSLGLEADYLVSAVDEDVSRLKPDPTGLTQLMSRAGVSASETLMIGDRIERDGEAAQRAGVRFVLRSRKQVPGYNCVTDYTAELFAPIRQC